ncbi:MAG: IS66 family insertion sequence element accessory protein TnpB, partial [Steroidobacteraceae bacterium]
VALARAGVASARGTRPLRAGSENAMKVDPFCGALLIFVSRRYSAAKLLYWHPNGFVVVHKVIESREKFIWPRLLAQTRRAYEQLQTEHRQALERKELLEEEVRWLKQLRRDACRQSHSHVDTGCLAGELPCRCAPRSCC